MALQLAEDYKGYVANYWRIISTTLDYNANQTRVELGLYKDAATREANPRMFVKKERHVLTGLYPEQSADDLRGDLYAAIKDQVMAGRFDEESGEIVDYKKFADAVDV